MSSPCPYICFNKTEYGYCRSTVCTNKTVIEHLTNQGCNTQFTYGPDSRCYKVPCSHCGGVGYVTINELSTTPASTVQCPICNGVGSVVHVENSASAEDMLEEKNPCKGCKHVAFRYPYPSMYPCNNCTRADRKDYYESREKNNG